MKLYKKGIACFFAFAIMLTFFMGNSDTIYAKEIKTSDTYNKYITVEGKNMRIVMYGNMNENGVNFADMTKTTLVMLPALGVPSPHLYFKPLAQSLEQDFNIVIVEPFLGMYKGGYVWHLYMGITESVLRNNTWTEVL